MEKYIREMLREIERECGGKILHAVESGSRAWGFASPDSDYDVRFIYVRAAKDYMRISALRDVIEWRLDEELDVNGWDLQKAFTLLLKSNPTLFEWNNSPIVYQTTPEWRAVQAVIDGYFRHKSGLFHYLSTARGNYREYLKGERVRLKKYFYVLRPILACHWILHFGTPPPMRFSDLAEAELQPALRPVVGRLLELKASTSEVGEGPRIDALNAYIDEQLEALEPAILQLGEGPRSGAEVLDELFYRIVQGGEFQ